MTTKPSALLRGFTLIEMIFIIVIVGIMMSLLVSSYQQRATNVKLTKAALQMQSLLQAASAYYKTYNCWPDANSTGQICKIEPVPPPTDFTPVGIDKDPWGGDYTQATATDSSQAFTVSATKVPKNLAARLAALIGATSTVCDNNLCTVTARVNSPFFSQAQFGNIAIQAVGSATKLQNNMFFETQAFNCPTGWTPTATAVIQNMDAAKNPETSCDWLYNRLISHVEAKMTSCFSTSSSGGSPYRCHFDLISEANVSKNSGCGSSKTIDYGYFGVTYIAYCIAPTSSS